MSNPDLAALPKAERKQSLESEVEFLSELVTDPSIVKATEFSKLEAPVIQNRPVPQSISEQIPIAEPQPTPELKTEMHMDKHLSIIPNEEDDLDYVVEPRFPNVSVYIKILCHYKSHAFLFSMLENQGN